MANKISEKAINDWAQQLGEEIQPREVKIISFLRIERLTEDIYFSEDKCIMKLTQVFFIFSIQ